MTCILRAIVISGEQMARRFETAPSSLVSHAAVAHTAPCHFGFKMDRLRMINSRSTTACPILGRMKQLRRTANRTTAKLFAYPSLLFAAPTFNQIHAQRG